MKNGGGVYIEEDFGDPAKPVFKNCLIVNNSGMARGAGIYIRGDSVRATFINCTISGNFLEWGNEGASIYSVFGSRILLVNTISYNNSPNEIFLNEEYPSNTRDHEPLLIVLLLINYNNSRSRLHL